MIIGQSIQFDTTINCSSYDKGGLSLSLRLTQSRPMLCMKHMVLIYWLIEFLLILAIFLTRKDTKGYPKLQIEGQAIQCPKKKYKINNDPQNITQKIKDWYSYYRIVLVVHFIKGGLSSRLPIEQSYFLHMKHLVFHWFNKFLLIKWAVFQTYS